MQIWASASVLEPGLIIMFVRGEGMGEYNLFYSSSLYRAVAIDGGEGSGNFESASVVTEQVERARTALKEGRISVAFLRGDILTSLTATLPTFAMPSGTGNGKPVTFDLFDFADFINVVAEHIPAVEAVRWRRVPIPVALYAPLPPSPRTRAIIAVGTKVSVYHVACDFAVPAGVEGDPYGGCGEGWEEGGRFDRGFALVVSWGR
ncbi:hypothetical protein BDK51DRAFT_41167, partial [Blyttiomyces helicus]